MVLAQVVVKEEAGGAEALSTHNILVNIQSPFNKRSLISLDTFLIFVPFSSFSILRNLTFKFNHDIYDN